MSFHRARATPAKGSTVRPTCSPRLVVTFDRPTMNRILFLASTQNLPSAQVVRAAVRRYFEVMGENMGDPPRPEQ